MPRKLPVISGRDAAAAFMKAGYLQVKGRSKGSHMVLHRTGETHLLTIPDHKELSRGTLRALIRLSGMTVDQFASLL